MADPFATYKAANKWLDGTKVAFADDEDALLEAQAAGRIIRGELQTVFPTHVNEWDASGTPEAVPELIEEIAALLMASYRYSKKYSEATQRKSEYAEELEARAMLLLEQLREGLIGLADVPADEAAVTQFGLSDFWPNDSTGVIEPRDDRRFAVGMEF